ncbi:8572_t:CDS:2, partial [Funneliformis geosporum]
GEKAGIRELSKSFEIKNLCADFVLKRKEVYQLRKFVLSSSEKIKLNAFHKVSNGSENSLVEIIVRLMDTAIYRLSVEYEIEVIRAERQSIASKNCKVQQKKCQEGMNQIL